MKNYYDIEKLNLAELLALTLREKPSSLTISDLLSKYGSLSDMYKASLPELTEVSGLGSAKAMRLKAALEIGRRFVSSPTHKKPIIKAPGDVANLLMPERRYNQVEIFKTVSLNTKNHVIKIDTISIGSLNATVVHPREVFKAQIMCSAAAVILVHSHPSGDPAYSKEDAEITKRLVDAGKLLGIEVLDHIIIGDGRYLSFKEQGLM